MTLSHYISLSKSQKQQVLLYEGVFLDQRTDGPFNVMLYQLDDFYVEVYLFNLYNKVALIKPFDDTSFLDEYLKTISLSGLLQEVFS